MKFATLRFSTHNSIALQHFRITTLQKSFKKSTQQCNTRHPYVQMTLKIVKITPKTVFKCAKEENIFPALSANNTRKKVKIKSAKTQPEDYYINKAQTRSS